MNKQLRTLIIKIPFLYSLVKPKYVGSRGLDNQELDYVLKAIGKDKLVLEIGTFTGLTTKELSKENYVVGIDCFKGNREDGTLYGEYPEKVYQECITNNLERNMMLLPMTSQQAFEFWDKFIQKEFDFILVDGLHTYEGVKTDYQWVKYLKKGGIIAFDDTELPEIERFLENNVRYDKSFIKLVTFRHMEVYKKIR